MLALNYQALFDDSPNPYLVLDRRLHIAGANKAYLASTNRQLNDIVGRWAWDAYPTDPETLKQSIASFERVIRTRAPDTMALLRFDIELPAEQGGGFEKRFWSITHTPVFDAAGEVELVLQHPIDVTELERLKDIVEVQGQAVDLTPDQSGIFKRAQQVYADNLLLKAQSDRLKDLFQHAPGFMTILRGPKHIFELANDTYIKLIGGRDVNGIAIADALPELNNQGFIALLDMVYATGKSYVGREMEASHRLQDGQLERRWVDFIYQPIFDSFGQVSGIFVEGSDVTDAKRAADLLRESEERLRLVVEGAKDHIIITTDPDARITSWSSGAVSILGWSVEEAVGQPFAIIFTPEDQDAGADAQEINTAAIAGSSSDQRWHARNDGGRVFLNGSVHPLPLDQQGKSQGFLKIARDETQRRRTDEALRDLTETLEQRVHERTQALQRTEEQLRQSQKMEAVGQLTGGLAHDFNNLLTGIIGSLDLLQRRIRQGRLDAVDRYIGAAQGAARRAGALTQRLLAFSRRQTLDPKNVDVNRLVIGMEELIQRTVGPSIQLRVSGAPNLWSALIDASQLENALLNLCINSRDAMPDGGRLTVELSNVVLESVQASDKGLEPGNYVLLCVTDSGAGMSEVVASRAFDPFFTTKPIGQGTGLGLSMVYGFARQSGGQVTINSEVGKGTAIEMYLPRYAGDVEPNEGDADFQSMAQTAGGETILVVDDEPTVRMLACDVLQEAGYATLEAEDGTGALQVLRSSQHLDLLVSDVGLPGEMNGRQVADAARALRPGLGVLFITGYAATAAVGNGQMEQGMDVLSKPFSGDELTHRVQALLKNR